MNIKGVKSKGVKIDLASKEIQITFTAFYNEENQEAAEGLVIYMGKNAPRGELEFISGQPELFLKEIKK